MANWKKLAQGAAGAAGGEVLNVEDVFSTYVYHGTQTQVGGNTITNNIDLATEGGMVWFKARDAASSATITDTVMGAGNYLQTASTAAQSYSSAYMTSFNTDGFTLGAFSGFTNSDLDYASWTFRKAPKFFDVVTYTGNGTAGLTIDHNLGSVPGCIIVKSIDDTRDWAVYHRGVDATAPEDYAMVLQKTVAREDNVAWWNDTAPTSTQFTVGNKLDINRSGYNYVAYLFAHNDGDGEFGPDGDADIIKCGSYTGDGTTNASNIIDLGFEPQWLLVKKTNGSANWILLDNMRGFVANTTQSSQGGDHILVPDENWSETYAGIYAWAAPTPKGFALENSFSSFNENGSTYVYIAIRRGPMAVPTSGTDVFKVDAEDSGSYNNPPLYVSDFPVDFALRKQTNNASSWIAAARLSGNKTLKTDARDVETTTTASQFDYNNGWFDDAGWNAAIYSWMWRRAPSFFDVITWKVDGTGDQTINHNLGVVPEMIWTKNRDDSGTGSGDWWIAHKDMTGWDSDSENDRHTFQGFAYNSSAQQGYHRDFSSTSIRLLSNAAGGYVTGHDCIGYLFASLDGVSKVGSFTGNGSSQTIDCGFSNGARFILIKRTDSGSSWTTYDTVRGIVSGADGYLALNSTSQQLTYDDIDPHSSGFIVNGPSVSGTSGQVNVSGASYIFYAVA